MDQLLAYIAAFTGPLGILLISHHWRSGWLLCCMASSINAYLGYKVGLTGMLIGAIVYLGIEFRGFCINRKVDASRINRKVGASDR